MRGPPLEQDVVVRRSLELDSAQPDSVPGHSVAAFGVAGELGFGVPGLESQSEVRSVVETKPASVLQHHRVAADGEPVVFPALPRGIQIQDLFGVAGGVLTELQVSNRLEQGVVQHQLAPVAQFDGLVPFPKERNSDQKEGCQWIGEPGYGTPEEAASKTRRTPGNAGTLHHVAPFQILLKASQDRPEVHLLDGMAAVDADPRRSVVDGDPAGSQHGVRILKASRVIARELGDYGHAAGGHIHNMPDLPLAPPPDPSPYGTRGRTRPPGPCSIHAGQSCKDLDVGLRLPGDDGGGKDRPGRGPLDPRPDLREEQGDVAGAEPHPIRVVIGQVEGVLAELVSKLGHGPVLVAVGHNAVLVFIAQYELDLEAVGAGHLQGIYEQMRLVIPYLGKSGAQIKILAGLEHIRTAPGQTAEFRMPDREFGHLGGDVRTVIDGPVPVENLSGLNRRHGGPQKIKRPAVGHPGAAMPREAVVVHTGIELHPRPARGPGAGQRPLAGRQHPGAAVDDLGDTVIGAFLHPCRQLAAVLGPFGGSVHVRRTPEHNGFRHFGSPSERFQTDTRKSENSTGEPPTP